MLDTLDLMFVADRYYRLLTLSKLRVREFSNMFPLSGEQNNLVAHAVFSDTLLMWSQPLQKSEHIADLGSVSTFFDVCNIIIADSIVMKMPLRVGIAFGQVCIHPEISLFVGKPIVDAYSIEEEQKWIGGACHTSCLDAPHFGRVDLPWHDVVEYEVPTQNSSQRMFALNWPRFTTEEVLSLLDQGAAKVVSPTVLRKYQETKTFFQYVYQINHLKIDEINQELERQGLNLINRKQEISNNDTEVSEE